MRRFLSLWRPLVAARLWALGIAAAVGAATAGAEQPPAVDAYYNEGLTDVDPAQAAPAEPLALEGAAAYGGGYGYGDVGPYEEFDTPNPKPVNWVAGPYLKAGPAGILGEGILDDPDVGWTVAGGYRQPLGPELGGDRFFFDLGGSYLSAYGETTRQTTFLLPLGNNNFLPVNSQTTLSEVKRASANIAVGWFWGSPFDDVNQDRQWRFASRLGGRLSHIRGEFEDSIDVSELVGGYGATDTSGGLFFGTEAILLDRQYALGNVQWTLDAELANDWMKFNGFESSSLGTASMMLGFMLTR